MLDPNTRYLQIAFNTDARQVRRILPKIPYDPRIIIEAGTPYIKLTGKLKILIHNAYNVFILLGKIDQQATLNFQMINFTLERRNLVLHSGRVSTFCIIL